MTYAGYQRYETPNLGAVAVEQIDKQKALDLKQQELDEAKKYKQATLDAKAKEDADKVAAAKAKQDEEKSKETNAADKELYTSISKHGGVPSTSGNTMIYNHAEDMKAQAAQLNQDYMAGKITESQYNQGRNDMLFNSNELGATWDGLTKTYNEVQKTKDNAPVQAWMVNTAMNDALPTTTSPKKIVTHNNKSYMVDAFGHFTSTDVLKNVSAIGTTKATNYEKDAKESVIDMLPKISMETPRKGGGTQTNVDQTTQAGYEEYRDKWVNTIINDPIESANAYSHFIGVGNVGFIKETASEDERKKAAFAMGYTDKNWEEGAKHLVEMKVDNEKGIYVPELSKAQKDELIVRMKKSVDNMAFKSKGISMPSTTNVNIKQTVENKVNEQANQKYVKLYEGSKGALNQFRSEIAAANGMASSAKPKWDGKDREWLEWDADGKGLILWTNTSKDKMNEEWEWDHILLEGDEAWPDPTAHIADRIKQATESANARAAGGATPKQSEQ